jgi:hypothetical protein
MIKYGPLCWPENEAEIDHPQCNYPKLYDGKFPVGVDKHGIPLDHKGRQCLDRSSILHPRSTVKTVDLFVSSVGTFHIPSSLDAKCWFDEEFLHFSVPIYRKYAIKYIVEHQKLEFVRLRQHYDSASIDKISNILLKNQIELLEEELKNES